MSNVDLTKEFTDMIIAQIQPRVIDVDQVLEEHKSQEIIHGHYRGDGYARSQHSRRKSNHESNV